MDQSAFNQQQYASFLIRIWGSKEPDAPGSNELHGEVEHIQTGQSLMFNSLEELWALVLQWAATLGSPPEHAPAEGTVGYSERTLGNAEFRRR